MSSVRILIADDSQALQTFMRQRLEQLGIEPEMIRTTAKPVAALEIAAEFKPDFLMTDWYPKEPLQGIALFNEVRQHNPECLFALVGHEKSAEQEALAMEAGALFFLKKPFTPDDMRAALKKVIEQLTLTHPKLATMVKARTAQAASTRPVIPAIVVPPLYKPGDAVVYQNRFETVKYVIARQGELVVQLEGKAGLIPADKIQRRA
jgi:DNA-binding NtrC family response regulator